MSRRVACCAALLCAGLVPGQQVVWQKAGVRDVIGLGGRTAFLGDVDGDGIGDPGHQVSVSSSFNVHVLIVSGKDGSTLRSHAPGPRPIQLLAAAGDMDGDGIGDYAIQTLEVFPQALGNIIEVRSGADDRLIWQVQGPWSDMFGNRLLGELDIDGDGRPNLLVSAPREGNYLRAAVYAYSHTGSLVYRVPILALDLGKLGDLDGDGCDDFIVGSGRPNRSGAADVFSGRTGQILVSGVGDPGDGVGMNVAGCGDVDGDGALDFAASSNGGFQTPGVVRVFSGRDGSTIHVWRRRVGSTFGWSLASGFDLDLDGVCDILVGSLESTPNLAKGGTLYFYSGRDGTLIRKIYSPDAPKQTKFAYWLAIGPPQPDSPFPVVAVSEPEYGFAPRLNFLGRLDLLRPVPEGVVTNGRPCAGTLAKAPRIGFRELGPDGVRIHLTNAPPAASATLLIGVSRTHAGGVPLPLSLDPLGFKGCSLQNSIDCAVTVTTGTAGNDLGYASLDMTTNADVFRVLKNVELHAQWVVLGGDGTMPGGLTEGLTWPVVRVWE